MLPMVAKTDKYGYFQALMLKLIAYKNILNEK
jgi:hypothetical protein